MPWHSTYAISLGSRSSSACGADPLKIVQLQWHASPCEELVEKMGISWTEAKKNFEAYLEEVKAGRIEHLYNPELANSMAVAA